MRIFAEGQSRHLRHLALWNNIFFIGSSDRTTNAEDGMMLGIFDVAILGFSNSELLGLDEGYQNQ